MSLGRGVNLRDEEEVAEYLKNLGTEYRQYRISCYDGKEAKGCHLLADYLETMERDSKAAFEVYLKNCDEHNYAHSCHKVAGYRSEGKGCERDMELSYDYFVKGCRFGHPRACLNAALLDLNENQGCNLIDILVTSPNPYPNHVGVFRHAKNVLKLPYISTLMCP